MTVKLTMAALPLTGYALHKSEMEYNGKFGHTIVRIQHIALMSKIDIFNTSCCLETQTVAPTLTGLKGIKSCIKYLASNPHKTLFYAYNFYDGSNFIRLTWSGNEVEDYKIQICLECHQNADHDITINKRW